MLIAVTLVVLGVLAGVAAAQLRGLRLGGVVVVPLLAVYTLRSFASYPVVIASVVTGYVAAAVVQRRLLWYGRRVFVVAVLAGALVPVTVFELLAVSGLSTEPTAVEFLGSVLPGIAAYNFWRIDADRRVEDALWTLAVHFLLVVVGIGLVVAVGLTPLRWATPPFLLGPQSDIAAAFGLTVGESLERITTRPIALAVLVAGFACSEWLRSRLGLRLGGVVVLPLLVLFAFRNGVFLWLYLVGSVVAGFATTAIHRWTLLYGRVLLSMAVGVATLTTVALVPFLPVTHGMIPLFVAVLSGVTAYNYHVTPPAERRATLVTAAGVFVGLAALARLLVEPRPDGFLRTVTAWHVLVGSVVCLTALAEATRLELAIPTSSLRRIRRRTERLLGVWP